MMMIGTVENGFLLRRQCCTSALLKVSTSVTKRLLFNSANFWEFFGTADYFLIFRRQCCTWALLMASTSVPKKQCQENNYSTMPFLMNFGHCLFFYYFPASWLYLALVVVGTTVPKQWLFISANFDDYWHS